MRFVWDTQVFVGVVESLNITYPLFTPEGVPLRAKLSLALKEYRPSRCRSTSRPRESPDVEKTYMVRRGDTLSDIAARVYRRSRPVARDRRANGISDPRTLAPGRS